MRKAKRLFLFQATAEPSGVRCPRPRFLEKLRASVSKYCKQRQGDFKMNDAVIKEMDEYRDWYSFNELGRVIPYVYQEVEKENVNPRDLLSMIAHPDPRT